MTNKVKFLYHATLKGNAGSILGQGLKTGVEGVVYLSESDKEAARFVWMYHPEASTITVFPVYFKKLDKSLLSESFDHNPEMFQHKAFTYKGKITKSWLGNPRDYSQK